MAERWTIDQLNSVSDLSFAACILNESKVTNYYSPKSLKIQKAVKTLDRLSRYEKAVKFFDMPIADLPLHLNDTDLTDVEQSIIKWRLAEGR